MLVQCKCKIGLMRKAGSFKDYFGSEFRQGQIIRCQTIDIRLDFLNERKQFFGLFLNHNIRIYLATSFKGIPSRFFGKENPANFASVGAASAE